VIGEGGKQGCTKPKIFVSPGGRQTAHITLHQEGGKMGVSRVLCAFITSIT